MCLITSGVPQGSPLNSTLSLCYTAFFVSLFTVKNILLIVNLFVVESCFYVLTYPQKFMKFIF
jgi:hypothetical protein